MKKSSYHAYAYTTRNNEIQKASAKFILLFSKGEVWVGFLLQQPEFSDTQAGMILECLSTRLGCCVRL